MQNDPLGQNGAAAFPAGFLWGAGTSAYQVEGAVRADGRGVSIWDTFSHTPGRTRAGETGDVAADQYGHLDEDVALMADLGIQSYRFSVSWPRVQPDGRGAINQAGLDYYQRMVDALLARDIVPFVTLYHWDLPQPLEDEGGWRERDTASRFAEYARAVHAALGDRVVYWTTVNEPHTAAFLGYGSGEHAPGISDPEAALRAAHHLLLAHGLALRAVRDQAGSAERFGIGLNLFPITPATDTEEDRDAARRVDALQNRLFLDPVMRGVIPPDLLDDVAPVVDLSHIHDGDEKVMGEPLDLLGVNYYQRHVVSLTSDGGETQPTLWPGSEQVRFLSQGLPRTAMGWESDSSGLRDVLLRLHHEYPRLPLYITENGAAYDDAIVNGRVHDPERVRFLDAHVRAVGDALSRGVDVRGYYVWSLLDNFEWAHGYSKRFGIVHVDLETLQRTLKDSALWYQQLIRRGQPEAPDQSTMTAAGLGNERNRSR